MSSIPYNSKAYLDAKVSMSNHGMVDAGRQMQSPASAGSRGLAKTTQFTNDKVQMQMGNSPIAESMIEIRSILNRIDGVNVPTNEMNELADNDKMEFTKLLLDISVMKDRVQALSVDEEAKASAIQSLTSAEEALVALDEAESSIKEESDYLYLRGKEIDQGSIMYKMEDYSDGIFELQSAKYADGTELDEKELEELESTQELIDWVMIDFVSESAHDDYQPMPEGDEFNIEEDEDFEEVLGALGFPEDETELFDAEYQGRKVPLNKPMRGDSKKFKVYVKDPKTGNVKKVNFGHGGTSAKKLGQKTMKIRKSNPKARKSFRARHNCANPGPKTKARYWSCRKW